MSHLRLSTEDVRWMRSRLGRTLRIALLMVAINLLGGSGPAANRFEQASSEPQATSTLHPVPPIGWRMTNRGWEYMGATPETSGFVSLDSLIQTQQSSEPSWARQAMESLSGLSPVSLGLLQITAIAIIAWVAERDKRHVDL